MRIPLPVLVAAMAVGAAGCAQTPADTAAAAQRNAATQASYAKALAGLVPRSTTTCLPNYQTSMSTQIYGDKIVYTVSRGLKYVNATTSGCDGLSHDDILVTRSYGSGQCAGDIARTVDRASGFVTGGCALGPFTEYRRP